MTREAARVSKVSALNSGGSERAWSISPMVSGGSLGRSAADAQRQAMSNPSKQVFRMGASGSRLPRITPLGAEKTSCQARQQGEMVGLLGPNGAAKTTTVSMIAGLLAPDRGEVRIEGGVVRGAGREKPGSRRGARTGARRQDHGGGGDSARQACR